MLETAGEFKAEHIRVLMAPRDRREQDKLIAFELVGPDGAHNARVLIDRPDGCRVQATETVLFERRAAAVQVPYHPVGLTGEYRVQLFIEEELVAELTVSD